MRPWVFSLSLLLVANFATAEVFKVGATYSVPVQKFQFDESLNPNYSTQAELESETCGLEAPPYIRYILPASLVGNSIPILLKKSYSEGGRYYYTGRNVDEAKCTFSEKNKNHVAVCFIIYENLRIDAAESIEAAKSAFLSEEAGALSNRMKATMLFASSEPRGFLHFQYSCLSASADRDGHEDELQ